MLSKIPTPTTPPDDSDQPSFGRGAVIGCAISLVLWAVIMWCLL